MKNCEVNKSLSVSILHEPSHCLTAYRKNNGCESTILRLAGKVILDLGAGKVILTAKELYVVGVLL